MDTCTDPNSGQMYYRPPDFVCSGEQGCRSEVEFMCCASITGKWTFQLVEFGDANPWFNAYLFLAALVNLYLALLINRNKALQAHPMKLFKYIAVADCGYLSNQFFS